MTDHLPQTSRGRLSLFIGLTSLAALAAAQPAPLHFFMLGDSQINRTMTDGVAKQMGYTPYANAGNFPGAVYVNGDGKVQGILIGLRQGFTTFAPNNLGTLTGPAPSISNAAAAAVRFFSNNGFFSARMAGLAQGFTSEAHTWTREDGTVGKPGQPTDVIRSIRFSYKADGLLIQGPSFMQGADVGMSVTGAPVVMGFTSSIRPLLASQLTPIMKTQNQIDREVAMDLRLLSGNGQLLPAVQRKQLIYFEQGQDWVQPAWLYDVVQTTPAGLKQPDYIVVPAAVNSPEPVALHFDFHGLPPTLGNPQDGSQPPPPASDPVSQPPPLSLNNLFADNGSGAIGALTPAAQANPVQIGEYIVREDHPCWLNDANAFWGSLAFTNAAAFWLPQKNRLDYYWDYRWLWEPDPGPPSIGDNSPWYPGHVHFALIEGHGAPWVITCYKDYGNGPGSNVVHLNQIAGYGTNQVPGEITSYIMWQSCDVIPEPGHPYEWDFQSPASAFDVWWQIFKGMRGNYGYRTLMHICNGVGNSFGVKIGLGLPNLWSWLDATDHSAFNHSNGWDYGSAVIVSGHENDRLYDNAQLPNPGSLTIWWIHA